MKVQDLTNLRPIKAKHSVPADLEACHTARVATLEPPQLIQPLYPKEVGPHNAAVQQDDRADTSVREALAEGGHRVLPGGRLR